MPDRAHSNGRYSRDAIARRFSPGSRSGARAMTGRNKCVRRCARCPPSMPLDTVSCTAAHGSVTRSSSIAIPACRKRLPVMGCPTNGASVAVVPLSEVQITATRVSEAIDRVPASLTVIRGEDLRRLGASDLRTALATVAGVDAPPGGDTGPAGGVPSLWGLHEFDAFLLVVDGVPWGGAFNPAVPTLDLNDVERIEIMKGAAPVMFGATSFVGVIHVIRYPAGESANELSVAGGSRSSSAGSLATPLPPLL